MERTHENLTAAATDRIRVFWSEGETIEQNCRRINKLVNAEMRRWNEMEEAGEVGLTKYLAKTEVLWYMQRLLQRMRQAEKVEKTA